MGLFDRLDTAPYGAYAVDLDQTVVFWNSQAEQILGYEAHDVLGRKCYEVVRGLALDGETPVCIQNCPGIIAARCGQIPPMAHVRVQCASGENKRVTVIPLVATDEADKVVLIHMFYETPADELRVDEPDSATCRRAPAAHTQGARGAQAAGAGTSSHRRLQTGSSSAFTPSASTLATPAESSTPTA